VACLFLVHTDYLYFYLITMSDRIEKIKAFLQATPNDGFLNHALALEYVKLGDEGSARKYFELNLTNDPAYVATYYHLGKLLERVGEQESAIATYEQGMQRAKEAKDMHSYNELQGAYEDLVY
jgi:tetratricopeptide (TPR) repeat protein